MITAGLTDRQLTLMRAAIKKHGRDITLPEGIPDATAAFSESHTGKLFFWFNTSDNSTHVITEAVAG